MQQSGEYLIKAPRDAVWQALNDPDVLARSIDGCESLTQLTDSSWQAAVKARIGPVSATFNADLEITDSQPPESYRLNASIKGGAAGHGKGTADVRLEETADGTRLSYDVNGSVGGKLAQVGSRMVDGAVRKMGDDFFRRFSDIVAPGGAERVPPAQPASRYESSGQGRIWIIVFGLLALAAALALLL